MKKFEFHQHELVRVWRGHTFTVTAESLEEAEAFVRENHLADTTDWHGNTFGGRVELIDTDKIIDVQEPIPLEHNAGIPTIVIQTPEQHAVADNCGNRHYLAESGGWRDRAIGLIKKEFEATDEQVVEFVDEFWANDSTDEENLFGFDLWLHGCDPFLESGKRELYAFTYPIDMGRDATDGEIVAAYESEENEDREYPVEKLTPDELAEAMNDEGFADQQLYVRFIRL